MQQAEKRNSKRKLIVTTVLLGIRHEPMLIGVVVCPHCDALQEDYYDKGDLDKQIILTCENCKKNFYGDVPNFDL